MTFTSADLVDAHEELQSDDVLGFRTMELNQIKRFIKDLEERTDSLRRYL
jgi:hypothetical protein